MAEGPVLIVDAQAPRSRERAVKTTSFFIG
jgi:hypothetical protein